MGKLVRIYTSVKYRNALIRIYKVGRDALIKVVKVGHESVTLAQYTIGNSNFKYVLYFFYVSVFG